MKKIIKTVDKEKGILQVTTLDERWYAMQTQNEAGLPEYRYIPSVTWQCGYYPKGIAFYKWLADKGWDESQALKNSAGERGSKVHQAIDDLAKGEEVKCTDKYETERGDEELTVEEWSAICSWVNWAKEVKPKFIRSEFLVISEKYNFAGTVDALVEIDGVRYIVDWKTSANIWTEYHLQISAYRRAILDVIEESKAKVEKGKKDEYTGEYKMAILQIGYSKNGKGWKWNEIEDKFDLFQHAQAIWKNENGESKPKQRDFPLSVKL